MRKKPDTNYTNCHELLEGRFPACRRSSAKAGRFVSIREIRVSVPQEFSKKKLAKRLHTRESPGQSHHKTGKVLTR